MDKVKGKINITITPECSEGMAHTLAVRTVISGSSFDEGAAFASLADTFAICRSARYEKEDITASDEAGALDVEVRKAIGRFGPEKQYFFNRKTSGDVTVTTRWKMPVRSFQTSDPGFTVYRNEKGCIGSLMTVLLIPDGIWDFDVHFDLSQMKDGVKAVSGYGEGDFSLSGDSDQARFVFFCIGADHRWHREGSKLSIVWFSDEMPMIEDFCELVGDLFDHDEKFFHDDDKPYYIFLYPENYVITTGTALYRTCLMGYGPSLVKDIKDEEMIHTVAHELIHNWVSIEDEDQTISTVYSEGNAEYYSALTAFRTGRYAKEQYVDDINKMIRGFYANPRKHDPEEMCLQEAWSHSFAQRTSYGRGVIMMMALDTLIRKETDGSKSLDDVVVKIAVDAQMGKPSDKAAWFGYLDELTDGKAEKVIEDRMSGRVIEPPADFFGDDYELSDISVRQFDFGFDDTVLFENPMKVHGLKPGSEAEKAGLRNGDVIVAKSPEVAPRAVFQISRNGSPSTVEYEARGAEVSCPQYVKKANN